VLVLSQFIAHQQSGPLVEAAKATHVRWAFAEGYGVAAIKLGLERYLAAKASSPSATVLALPALTSRASVTGHPQPGQGAGAS
jgi:hypothetical protein